MSHDEEYANAKMKLLWSSTREQDSVLLTPDECRALLKELPDPEEGTVDIKRREYEYDSEKPRSTGVPGMRDDGPAVHLPVCAHLWAAHPQPDRDAKQCVKCGAVHSNAQIAQTRYHEDQERGKSYDWSGDPGDEQ